jgi:hypothetical protein
MDDNETYDPTWRDDSELCSLLLAAKITGLAGLDAALDIRAGHRAIVAGDLPQRQVVHPLTTRTTTIWILRVCRRSNCAT